LTESWNANVLVCHDFIVLAVIETNAGRYHICQFGWNVHGATSH
jgi:hypothetical protein